MIYRVRLVPDAQLQVDELDAWWTENRPRSKVRVSDAVEQAFARLAETPNRGTLYKRVREHEVRQYRLGGTPYALYYVVNEKAAEVVVVSAWSRVTEIGPPID